MRLSLFKTLVLMGVLGLDKVPLIHMIDAYDSFLFESQHLAPSLSANKIYFGGNGVSVRSMASMMPVQHAEDGHSFCLFEDHLAQMGVMIQHYNNNELKGYVRISVWEA
ncbi:hypothetical protein AAC387_Pa08g1052 [Persea americana]